MRQPALNLILHQVCVCCSCLRTLTGLAALKATRSAFGSETPEALVHDLLEYFQGDVDNYDQVRASVNAVWNYQLRLTSQGMPPNSR